jgi:hypothetical protein
MASAKLCDNWGCPAAVSCIQHFGRSRAYAAFKRQVPTETRQHNPLTGHCAEYRCDQPRVWNLSAEMIAQLQAALTILSVLNLVMVAHIQQRRAAGDV